MVYTYEFAMAATTATIAVLTKANNNIFVLLGRRDSDADTYPNAWCLPGGYVDVPERIKDAAVRELREETNTRVDPNQLNLFYIDDKPGSDPRYEQVVNVCYYVFLNRKEIAQAKAGSDLQELKWVDLNKVPRLAFAHNNIIEELKDILT